jgi:hypothetical protein
MLVVGVCAAGVGSTRSRTIGGARDSATFGPSSDLARSILTFEYDQFTLEGHGPVSTSDVMVYDHTRRPVGGVR